MTLAKLTCLYLALTVLTLFSGCSKKQDTNWLIGEWEFDRDMTAANLPSESKTTKEALLIKQLMAQADKGTISFTSTQVTFTTPSDTGTSGYSILEEPDDDILVIKTADGQVTTFTQSGEFLILPSNVDVPLNSYFRRKN